MAQESITEISISGLVKKHVDGTPLAGATVLALGPGGTSRSPSTNSNGEYVLEGLIPGEWKIMAWHKEYTPASPQSFQSTSSVGGQGPEFTLESGSPELEVVGVVHWHSSQQPVIRAVVEARSANVNSSETKPDIALTDTHGRFRFEALLPGRYVFTVLHKEGQGEEKTWTVIDAHSGLRLYMWPRMQNNDARAGRDFLAILCTLLFVLVGAYLWLHTSAHATTEPLLPVFINVIDKAQARVDSAAAFQPADTLTSTAQISVTTVLAVETTGIRNAWDTISNTTTMLHAEIPMFAQLVDDIEAAQAQNDVKAWDRRVSVLDRLVNDIAVSGWFWIQEPWRFLEVLFWGLAGALVNLIITTGRYLRFERFYRVGIPMHIAQLVTIPLLALVFVLLLSQVTITVKLVTSDLRIDLSDPRILVAVSFLLGSRFWQLWDFLQETAGKIARTGE